MSKRKRPDNIVYNEEEQKYDAALKPYGTNIGAPSINMTDTIAWKNRNVHKVNKQFDARYQEIKAQYDSMMEQYEYNELVYGAKFNFEPVIGYSYHMYKDKHQELFLSIIAPNECNFDFVGSFRLSADLMWEKVDLTTPSSKR